MQLAVRYGGATEYHALKKFWAETTSIDGKEIAVRAMGRIQTHDLLQDFFQFLFKTVPTQDAHTGAAALAANAKTRTPLWEYIQQNFDGDAGLYKVLGANMVVLDRFLKLSLNRFADLEKEQEIANFFSGRDNRGYDRTLGVVSDTIKGRAAYRKRDREVVSEWFKAHGYA